MTPDDLERWLRWRTRTRVPAAAVPRAAQTVYDDLLKGVLSPAFRALGFTGSAGRYSLGADGCWALLGMQKSAYSDGNEVRFTANLFVANKERWASMLAEKPYLPKRPAPSTSYGEGIAQSRIGQLLPDPADTWWRLYDGVDLGAVAEDVTTSIERYALPWLREQLIDQGCGCS